MGTSRDARAKEAKLFINKKLPAILKSNARARKGVESSELIVDPLSKAQHDSMFPRQKAIKGKKAEGMDEEDGAGAGTDDNTHTPIRLWAIDTLEASSRLAKPSAQRPWHMPRVAILNMASPLRPGGGVLTGATSQEEWLCARTSLYPSLREEFYRLPEVGAVYTPDVLVCKHWDDEATELQNKDRFYVDVVTAAMLRLPDTDERDGERTYSEQKDRELVLRKMRAVVHILELKGVEKVVLGAWGCGAYGNPVREVAQAWRRVLQGPDSILQRHTNSGTGVDVVFAIKDVKMAKAFAASFGPGMVLDERIEGDSELAL